MAESSLPTLLLDETNFERAINFFGIYDLEAEVGFEKKKTFLGTKTPRVCRFCRKRDKEVKFSNDAHVLPQFMGNRYLVSYFECNTCNKRFSLYEDSLSKYIGITRTVHQIRGKAGTKVPTFKDPTTKLQLFATQTGLGLAVEDGQVDLDQEGKRMVIKTIRHAYVPLHIPKSLLKIGFCLLSDDELDNYESLRGFLEKDVSDYVALNHPMFHVYGYFIPGPTYFKHPTALLYTKKADKQDYPAPQKQVVIQYANYVFQMPMTFNEQDRWIYQQEVQLPLHPLMIDARYFERFGNYQVINLNLTSAKKKKGEPHVITFNIDTVIRPGQDEV